MSQFVSLVLLFTILYSLPTIGQSLPDEWSISDDGHMLTAGGVNDSGFFSEDEVHDIQLQFDQTNWWSLMENNYEAGIDILATCWIDGEQYDSVGVRFKGQTSYFQNNTEKKSFNITLDYMIEGQDVEGYSTLNLNCGWGDNSSMREVLFNNVGHNYYMSLKSNYSTLSLNGENWGLYQCVQQFNSNYIKEWYESNDGTIWRALRTSGTGGPGGGPGGGGGMFGAGTSSLNYNGPDSTDYNTDYTLKRTELDNPWAGLIAACDVLNNEPLESLEEQLSSVLDIDKTCWFLAHELIFADDDSYINKGGMDYYIYYEAETNRLIPMEYDGNSVLGGNHLTWDLFYNEDDDDFPLLNRMLAIPSIRQRFLAHVRTILNDYFNPSFTDAKIDQWVALIDPLIEDDPKKFYTYGQFQNSVENLKQIVGTRRNTLLNHAELENVSSLSINDASYTVNELQWQIPSVNDEVDVVAQVSGSIGIASVWLYYGAGFTGSFTKLEMYDDGMHNDGAAQDGQYGAAIPSHESGIYIRYYVAAIADDVAATVSYEPKGAEHDVFLYQVEIQIAFDTPIVINELMADNETAIVDSFDEYDDWLELYNVSSSAVDLSGWTLTDNINELDRYIIPSGTMLDPDSYLMIWADDDEVQGPNHAAFKLSANGETLSLLNNARELVDQIEFPATTTDFGFARVPNGIGDFMEQTLTFGANNDLVSSVSVVLENIGFQVVPNPATSVIMITANEQLSRSQELIIYNSIGAVIWNGFIKTTAQIDISSWTKGLYIVRTQGAVQRLIVR